MTKTPGKNIFPFSALHIYRFVFPLIRHVFLAHIYCDFQAAPHFPAMRSVYLLQQSAYLKIHSLFPMYRSSHFSGICITAFTGWSFREEPGNTCVLYNHKFPSASAPPIHIIQLICSKIAYIDDIIHPLYNIKHLVPAVFFNKRFIFQLFNPVEKRVFLPESLLILSRILINIVFVNYPIV